MWNVVRVSVRTSLLGSLCGIMCLWGSVLLAQEKSLANTLIALEQQLCEGFAAKDTQAVTRLLAPEAMTAEEGQTFAGKAAISFHMDDVVIKSYKLSDFKVVPITKDVAVVYMKAVTDATRGGKKLAPVNYVSTIWVKRGNKWQASYSSSYSPQE